MIKENRSFCENSKKKIFFYLGGGGGGGGGGSGGGSVGFGGQGGCERRSKVFVRIPKKKFEGGGSGCMGTERWDGNRGGGGRGGGGGGGGGGSNQGLGWGRLGSKVRGRWVMWGMGDVNQE